MIKQIAISAFLLAAIAPVASAQMTTAQVERCQMLGQTFDIKKANVATATEKRDALAADAEAKGEAWENAEALRLFSADKAAVADAAKAAFDEARKAFNFANMALRSQTRMLQQDSAVYNAACAAEDG